MLQSLIYTVLSLLQCSVVEIVEMATSSFGIRKPKTSVQTSSVKKKCPFSVSRSPVTRQKRDVVVVDDYRQRSVVERMKDAFRTISFRSEPTIGEEDLNRWRNTQTPFNGRVNSRIGYPVDDKKRDELVQNLVPDCYEHLQNFHHYRSDMERLNAGFKVLYLSAKNGKGKIKDEKELRRVYGQTSAKTQRGPRQRWHGFGKPRHWKIPRKPKSTTVTMASEKSCTPTRTRGVKMTKNLEKDKQPNWKNELDRSEASSKGKDLKRANGSADSAKLTLTNADKRLSFQEDPRISGNDGMPSFKLEHDITGVQSPDIQRSSYSLASDISPKPPMTTPELDMSRRSSVRTLVFESQEELVENEGNPALLPKKFHNKSDHSPHYLAPFHSRFPHLKVTESASSLQNRQKRNISGVVPPWQQYRILCDAFRPIQQQNYQLNGYKKPKFATATELEYYIDIVSETNSNSGMYFS